MTTPARRAPSGTTEIFRRQGRVVASPCNRVEKRRGADIARENHSVSACCSSNHVCGAPSHGFPTDVLRCDRVHRSLQRTRFVSSSSPYYLYRLLEQVEEGRAPWPAPRAVLAMQRRAKPATAVVFHDHPGGREISANPPDVTTRWRASNPTPTPPAASRAGDSRRVSTHGSWRNHPARVAADRAPARVLFNTVTFDEFSRTSVSPLPRGPCRAPS